MRTIQTAPLAGHWPTRLQPHLYVQQEGVCLATLKVVRAVLELHVSALAFGARQHNKYLCISACPPATSATSHARHRQPHAVLPRALVKSL